MSKRKWTYEQHAAGHAYFRTISQEKAKRITELEAVYDHPNHDDPKQRYLYEIRCAIKLLREFSGREGGGENAMRVAVQLDQFYKRARKALKG